MQTCLSSFHLLEYYIDQNLDHIQREQLRHHKVDQVEA